MRLSPREGEELGDARFVERAVALGDGHIVADVQRALKDAADGDAAEVIGVIEIGDQDLQRALGVAGSLGNGGDDGLKERLQIHAGRGRIGRRRAFLGHRVEHRKIQLRLIGVEVDEKIVNFVQHFLRPGVGAVNLVDHHDGRSLASSALAST